MKPTQCLEIDSEDEDFDGNLPDNENVASSSKAPGLQVEEEWDEADELGESSEDWDDYYDEIDELMPGTKTYGGVYANRQVSQRTGEVLKLAAKINVEPLATHKLSHDAHNSMLSAMKKNGASKNLGLTKDDRATVEQVLDPRTMLVLSKMMKRGLFDQIAGCISTGKEANVYHARATVDPTVWTTTRNPHDKPAASEEQTWELAVKVYKTSVLVFKDRARYVEGEFRFRRGYCKSNPRKMVAMWAEKEMRNLRRMRNAHLPCPIPVEVRQNVLVMEHIGEDGKAAPRLKDADVDSAEWGGLYAQLLRIIRTMFQACKLVHGDLSEYNVLYLRGKLQVIDVSQSVEHDHPQALEFLKRDLVNVNDFFSRMGVPCIAVKTLFDFVLALDDAPQPEVPLEALPPRMEAELQRLLAEAPHT